MFYEAILFNQPLNDWRVDQVTDMNSMFADAAAFDHPLGIWTVGNVGDFRAMAERRRFGRFRRMRQVLLWQRPVLALRRR